MKKKFVIIDAMAIAYRSYFAFMNRPLTTSMGEPVSAIYGFVNQLFKIIDDLKPDYIAVATDSKEKTFRHERYELYKSSRSEMPEDMIPQIYKIYEIIEAFNIPLYKLPGYEADDLIGTAVKLAEKEGLTSYAITPDKDYVQLISENINLVKPGKATENFAMFDLDKAREEYGFEPLQMIDYLALVGDSSDDIPGVAGVGPKTATPLIQEFGSVEGIYENIDKITKKGLHNKLVESKENAFLSKELATIITDVPFEFDIEKTEFQKPDFDKLMKLFTELEFKAFGPKLVKIFSDAKDEIEVEIKEEDENTSFDKDKVKYKLITTVDEAKNLLKYLEAQEIIVFDTETDSLDTFDVNLAGASFCVKKGEAFFVATNPHTTSDSLFAQDLSDRLSVDDFVKLFKKFFENKKIKKVCQNGKYDIAVLESVGINMKGFYFDTMLASYVIDPDEKHGMDALSQKFLNYTPIPISELIGEKKDASKIFEADLQKLSDYACEDADITFRLYKILEKEIEKAKLNKLAYDVEFPLVEVLNKMERSGVKIDKIALGKFSKELQILMDEYTRNIYNLAGTEFNINSPKQLQVILFEDLKLKPTKKTKTGYSTNAQALEDLKGEHEIIETILSYRQVAKLKSTYSDALPDLIQPKTGMIHTTFNQTVASTGRLSSLNPNLQNIPIRTAMGKEIRKAFVAKDDNHILFSADYSQIELRIMASICEDKNLMQAFIDGLDIHRSTAAKVFMVSEDEVTADMRRKAKEVNFGILYGIGPFGLKTRLGITQGHAKEIIDTYFSTFPNVKQFIDDSIKNAQEKGYAETLLGRRRFLKNINSKNRAVRQFEERVATNMPIQGTAADMIKLAMIDIHNELIKLKVKTKMILQVHDELIFDMHKDEMEDLKPMIIEKMENAFKINVPLVVDFGVGNNWLDAH